jgi:hypothetical protein
VGLVFIVIPKTEPIDWFLFSDIKVTLQTHVYFICERLVLVIMAWIIVNESKEYRGALWIFFALIVMDVVDYIVGYNSVWFRFHGFPVSMNTVSAVVFAFVILKEWKRRLSSN